MKTFQQLGFTIKIVCLLSFIIFFESCFSQTDTTHYNLTYPPTLEYLVNESVVIVEGDVTDIKEVATKNDCFTSAIIRVSKIFKGVPKDSVEILYKGGYCNGQYAITSHGISLTKGQAGIFLLRKIDSIVTVQKDLQAYQSSFFIENYIGYYYSGGAHPVVGNRWAHYNDLEKDLYQRIEKATNTPRKIILPKSYDY